MTFRATPLPLCHETSAGSLEVSALMRVLPHPSGEGGRSDGGRGGRVRINPRELLLKNVQTLVDRQNACLHLKCRNSIKYAAISPGRSWEFSSKLGLVSQSLQRLSYHFANCRHRIRLRQIKLLSLRP